jgi:hypothetical protein
MLSIPIIVGVLFKEEMSICNNKAISLCQTGATMAVLLILTNTNTNIIIVTIGV